MRVLCVPIPVGCKGLSITLNGLNYPVYRKALSDFVLICPNRLGASTVSDASAGNILLSDIGTLTVSADVLDRTQLSYVKPMSTVMLHEILHMVTRWDVTTTGTIDGQNMIVDHTCEYDPLMIYITNADCSFTRR